MHDDTTHAQGAPKGNAVTAASVSGRPQQGPLLAALAVGTDLWDTSIPCNVVRRVRKPAPHTPPAATLFGTAFAASLLTFEYVIAPNDGSADVESEPTILIQPVLGDRDPSFLYMFLCLICWRSKLQTVTAQSTHEAELIAVALASNELIWIRKFMIEIGFAIGARTPICAPCYHRCRF